MNGGSFLIYGVLSFSLIFQNCHSYRIFYGTCCCVLSSFALPFSIFYDDDHDGDRDDRGDHGDDDGVGHDFLSGHDVLNAHSALNVSGHGGRIPVCIYALIFLCSDLLLKPQN